MQEIVECRGAPSDYEGACVIARHGAVVESLGVPQDVDMAEVEGEHGLDLERPIPWLVARRIFDEPRQAERFVRALKLASHSTRERADLTGQQLSNPVGERLAQSEAGPLYRIARWVESGVALGHHKWLAKQPRTRIRVGGRPVWYQPRPNPRDPRNGYPMAPLVQFTGALDPALPGDEKTRFFVFGPSDFEGDDGRYAILWQDEARVAEHHAMLVRDNPAGFAVVAVDFVQMTPNPRRGPYLPDSYHKATLIWRSTPGEPGTCAWTPFEGGIGDAATEMLTCVAGLEDEGYRVMGGDIFQQPWLHESLRKMAVRFGRPEAVPPRLFFHGTEYEYVRLFGGYTLWTTARLNTVEDDLIARAWPGIGGEPEAVTGLVGALGKFGEGPLMAVMTFAESEQLDHPHVEYGDQGLAYVTIPRTTCGARVGQVVLQSF